MLFISGLMDSSFSYKLRAKIRIFGRIRVRKMHFNTDLNWRVFFN